MGNAGQDRQSHDSFCYKSLNDITSRDVSVYPLVDTHMHIQSNDIAPLPIMKGLEIKNIAISNKIFPPDGINYDDISFLDGYPGIRHYKDKEKKDVTPGILAKSIRLADVFHNAITLFSFRRSKRRKLTDALALVSQYGKVALHNSFYIAGLYRHDVINGQFGIASHIREGTPNKKDIDKSKQERTKLIVARDKTVGAFKEATAHYYTYGGNVRADSQAAINAVFDFSVILGMELMYAHYWGAYGIPIYVYYDDFFYMIVSELTLSEQTTDGSSSIVLHNGYDIPPDELAKCVKIDNPATKRRQGVPIARTQILDEVLKKRFSTDNGGKLDRYCHFLEKLDTEELNQYESFEKHLEYTRMAALYYPLNYLPFYHFDARRFFSGTNEGDITQHHDFYIKGKGGALQKLDLARLAESFCDTNTRYPWRYRFDIEDLKKELLGNGGLFWGIKMYVALGYPPYIYDKSKSRAIFPRLTDNSYEGLKDFYIFCADNDVPVICHGSPQGMTIADPGVYLKEYLKHQPDSKYVKKGIANFPIGYQDFMRGLGLIDDFSSPYNWELVLNDLGDKAKKFKLCLAHFGGKRFWSGEFKESSPYYWIDGIISLIENPKYCVYTDISYFDFKGVKKFPDLSEKIYLDLLTRHEIIKKIYDWREMDGEKTYFNKSGYLEQLDGEEGEWRQSLKLQFDIFETLSRYSSHSDYKPIKEFVDTAKKLKEYLENPDFKFLRHRILFGTDWPMVEMSNLSVPRYNSTVFLLLQYATHILAKNKFDLWHQFSVINPLRFLGLLNETNDDAAEFTVNLSRLEKFRDNLTRYASQSYNEPTPLTGGKKYPDTYGFETSTKTRAKIDANYVLLRNRLESLKIPSADKIKTGGRWLITGEE
jgi:predicted TIM-barrel fold metal-dependent hydrolase